MELVCEDCRTMIQVPAERIPQKSPFRVTCPRCRGKIVVRTRASEDSPEAYIRAGPVNTLRLEAVEMKSSDDEVPQLVRSASPSEHPTALLCIDKSDSSVTYQKIIERLGFLTDIPLTPDQALQRLSLNQYALILLDDEFGENSAKAIADYIRGLSMSIRRDMLVVLVGERLKTGNPLQAFVESVDLVLHPADVEQLAPMATRAFHDHRYFYKVFNDCLREAGKKVR